MTEKNENFKAPLRVNFWKSKCTLYSLKEFSICLVGNRPCVPLTLGKLGTRGTLAVRLAVKQLQPALTLPLQGVQHVLSCTDSSTV